MLSVTAIGLESVLTYFEVNVDLAEATRRQGRQEWIRINLLDTQMIF